LGTECHRKLRNTLCWNSIPTQNTPRGGFLPGVQSSVTGEDPGPLKKGGNYPTIRKHNRILFNPLSSTEEEWSDEASDQPETVESMGGDPHFKMEGITTLGDLLHQEDWMVKVD